MIRNLLAAIALSGCAATCWAGEVYFGAGLPGVMLGYAYPLNDSVTVRGDWATLGKRRKQLTEEGLRYDAELGFNRLGLFGDWFYFGGLRLTAGLTFNNLTANLAAKGDGGQLTVGGQTFTSDPNDRLDVKISYPKTTPYLGLGYGHQMSSGLGFTFDLGASFGKATLSESHSGPNLGNTANVSQADIDRELGELRDGIGKIRAIPQLSLGINYRF